MKHGISAHSLPTFLDSILSFYSASQTNLQPASTGVHTSPERCQKSYCSTRFHYDLFAGILLSSLFSGVQIIKPIQTGKNNGLSHRNMFIQDLFDQFMLETHIHRKSCASGIPNIDLKLEWLDLNISWTMMEQECTSTEMIWRQIVHKWPQHLPIWQTYTILYNYIQLSFQNLGNVVYKDKFLVSTEPCHLRLGRCSPHRLRKPRRRFAPQKSQRWS